MFRLALLLTTVVIKFPNSQQTHTGAEIKEEGVENQEPGVEDDKFGEEAGPQPRHTKGDLVTEAVNVEMLHQEDHAVQVQVEVIHPPRICLHSARG